jgi:hypothetical protein
MNIQKELMDWADKTVNVYNPLAQTKKLGYLKPKPAPPQRELKDKAKNNKNPINNTKRWDIKNYKNEEKDNKNVSNIVSNNNNNNPKFEEINYPKDMLFKKEDEKNGLGNNSNFDNKQKENNNNIFNNYRNKNKNEDNKFNINFGNNNEKNNNDNLYEQLDENDWKEIEPDGHDKNYLKSNYNIITNPDINYKKDKSNPTSNYKTIPNQYINYKNDNNNLTSNDKTIHNSDINYKKIDNVKTVKNNQPLYNPLNPSEDRKNVLFNKISNIKNLPKALLGKVINGLSNISIDKNALKKDIGNIIKDKLNVDNCIDNIDVEKICQMFNKKKKKI